MRKCGKRTKPSGSEKGKQAQSLSPNGRMESCDPSPPVWWPSTSVPTGQGCAHVYTHFPLTAWASSYPSQGLTCPHPQDSSPRPQKPPAFPQSQREHMALCQLNLLLSAVISPLLKATDHVSATPTCAMFHILTSLESGYVLQSMLFIDGRT